MNKNRNQTEEERNQLRVALRDHGEFIKKMKDRIIDVKESVYNFQGALDRENQYYKKIAFPSEALIDYQNVRTLSELGVQQAVKLKLDPKFSIRDLINRLVRKFTPESIDGADGSDSQVDWYAIGLAASSYLRSVQVTGFMNGSLEVKAREKKKRKPKKKLEEKSVPKVIQPEQVGSQTDDEKTQNDMRVKALAKTLKTLPETDFFEFVINPNSFTETVENLFDLSFLVKDGLAKIEFDEDGLPRIASCGKPNPDDLTEGLKNAQCVVKFDLSTFQEMVKVNGIHKSMISTREREEENAGKQQGRKKRARTK